MKHSKIYKYAYFKNIDRLYSLDNPMHRVSAEACKHYPYKTIIAIIKSGKLTDDVIYVVNEETHDMYGIKICETHEHVSPLDIPYPNIWSIDNLDHDD